MNRKHIICFGDSNTHGYCGDAADFDGVPQPGGAMRFSEASRWPRLVQAALGEEYLIIEEGLNGRTTVFEDPFRNGITGAGYIWPCLMSTSRGPAHPHARHERRQGVVRRVAGAHLRGHGIPRLSRSEHALLDEKGPNILVVAPPPIAAGLRTRRALPSSAQKRGTRPWRSPRSTKRRLIAWLRLLRRRAGVRDKPRGLRPHARRGCRFLAAALVEIIPGLCV